jgi:hypothetical protein
MARERDGRAVSSVLAELQAGAPARELVRRSDLSPLSAHRLLQAATGHQQVSQRLRQRQRVLRQRIRPPRDGHALGHRLHRLRLAPGVVVGGSGGSGVNRE